MPFLFFLFWQKGAVFMKQSESRFQSGLIRELKARFPGCVVTKLDSAHIQGIPDLLVLNGNRWAALEVKRDARASHRPNQEHYVRRLNDMSFARFISPENKEEVLNELEQAFGAAGTARDPVPE